MEAKGRYGALAERHWKRWRPVSYAALGPNPGAYFRELSEEVEQEIEELAETLAGDDPGKETYLQKLGRLTEARQRAESQVLRERVLLEPDPGYEEDSEAPGLLAQAKIPSYLPALLVGAEENELTPEQEAEAQELYNSESGSDPEAKKT